MLPMSFKSYQKKIVHIHATNLCLIQINLFQTLIKMIQIVKLLK